MAVTEYPQSRTGAPWFSSISETTDDGDEDLSASDVIERVNEILGYDILEEHLMAEGYTELGAEMLEISESTQAAGYEALPPE